MHSSPSVIRMIKTRMGLACSMNEREEDRMLLLRKSEGKRSLGRPKRGGGKY
jgi:hypothetical protein